MPILPSPSAPESPLRGWLLLALVAAGLACGCRSSWRTASVHERWTLYERPGTGLPRESYEAAFERAFDAVESALGPFESRVDVHAWDATTRGGNARAIEAAYPTMAGGLDAGVHEIPGIGPARIQAWHARRRGGALALLGLARGGVFTGVADTGTAVHELVHARMGEAGLDLPLWFEEGVASLLGDGALVDGRWVVDGLACWPLRELSEEHIDHEALVRLLSLDAAQEASVRENVLVHFVGWALVFDLYRETGSLDWRTWFEMFEHLEPEEFVYGARARLERTLDPETALDWLDALDHPDPARRLACAKGTWKLRSPRVLERLLEALAGELDPEVRVALAVNALAAAGELRLSRAAAARVQTEALAALASAELRDRVEAEAALTLHRAWRNSDAASASRAAFEALARFWEE